MPIDDDDAFTVPWIPPAATRLGLQVFRYLIRPRYFSQNARLYLLGSMLMGLGHGAVWVHMNLYYRALGLGEGSIGRILSAGSLGTVLAALPAAVWVDRVPAQAVFVAAALGFVAALAAQLATAHWAVLALAAAITRALFTVHWVAALPFFMRNAGDRDRVELFSFAMALETLATVVSAAGRRPRLAFILGRAAPFPRLAASAAAPRAVPLLIRAGPPAAPAPCATTSRPELAFGGPPCLPAAAAPAHHPFLNLYSATVSAAPRAIGAFPVAQLVTMLGYLAGPLLARRWACAPSSRPSPLDPVLPRAVPGTALAVRVLDPGRS
jgi:MFS family permease